MDHGPAMVKRVEQRPDMMRALLSSLFSRILDKHDHDLTKVTMERLEVEFEAYFSVTGATRQKAITFFLKAAQFAEIPLSAALQSQLRNTGARTKRCGSQQRIEQQENEIEAQGSGMTGASHGVQLESGGRLTIKISANPFTMSAEDRTFFFSLVDMLQKYGEQHPEAQQETEEEMP